jgi:hypothetical protein
MASAAAATENDRTVFCIGIEISLKELEVEYCGHSISISYAMVLSNYGSSI